MASRRRDGTGVNVADPRPRCACENTRCKLYASPGSEFALTHHPDPAVRSERMREVRRGREQSLDFTGYRNRPGDFAAEVLGVRLWVHQVRVLEALRDAPRVSWRSCNGAGKTTASVVAALWRLLCWESALVFIIGPNARLVRQVTWRAIQRIVRGAPGLRDLEPVGSVPELGWRPLPDRLLLGLTSDKPEGVAGLHDAHVTGIEEEASGIAREMHEAVLGSCTGDARLLLLGNPLHRVGHFYDSFTRKRDIYNVLHTSYLDVVREAGDIPGLIDQRYVDEIAADYGELSAVFRTRCLGEPPDQGDDNVIPFSLVEDARARWSPGIATGPKFDEAGPLEIGVDPARYGDDSSCVVARRGLVALEPITYQQLDGVQLAARVLEVASRLRKPHEVPIVRVDAIGIGASVVDQLGQAERGTVKVVPINVGEAATVETYERLRDEVWICCREWLKSGGALPPDEKLAGELTAPTFGFSPRGRLKVESKDETKKRIRRSPDRADALCLAVYSPRVNHAEKFRAAMRSMRAMDYGVRRPPAPAPRTSVPIPDDTTVAPAPAGFDETSPLWPGKEEPQ